MLQETIAKELKAAMIAKDELRLSVFRMLLATLQNRTIQERAKRGADAVLGDEDVVQAIRGELKKRNDAAEAFTSGGRAEAAARERDEAAILATLLPAELSDETLDALVREGIRELGIASESDFGKLMGWLKGRVKGQASGERVSAAARKGIANA